MGDYSKITQFSTKDGLSPGDPNKTILGADHDAEYDAIETASATKADKSTPAAANNLAGLDSVGNLTDSGITTNGSGTITSPTILTPAIAPQDGTNEGGEIILDGAGAYPNVHIDLYQTSLRMYTPGVTELGYNAATGTLTVNSLGTSNVIATTFTGNLAGNVTGNVTGNVSGSSGSCTGNSLTATTAYGVALDSITFSGSIYNSLFSSTGTLFSSQSITLGYGVINVVNTDSTHDFEIEVRIGAGTWHKVANLTPGAGYQIVGDNSNVRIRNPSGTFTVDYETYYIYG